METFVSVQNMKNLMNVMSDFLQEKHGIQPQEVGINLKKVLFEQIQNVMQRNPDQDHFSLRDVNHQALKGAKDYILSVLHRDLSRPQNREPTDIVARDSDLFGNRPMLDNTHLTTPMVQVSSKVDVLKEFEEISNVRKMEMSSKVDENLAIDAPLISETPYSDDAFKEKLNMIMAERELKGNEHFQSELTESANNTATYTGDYLMSSAIINNDILVMPNDPKSFYEIQAYDVDTSKQQSREEPFARDQMINVTTNVLKEKYLYTVIDSVDRSWGEFPNKYSFRVRFDYALKESISYQVYENNPTVPYLLPRGTPNINGWDHPYTGMSYSAYDPNRPKGNVVGTEEITIEKDKGAYVEAIVKNVANILFNKIIIPMEVDSPNSFANAWNSAQGSKDKTFNFNFPYVLLRIEEFDNLIGTNDIIRRSFCQFEYEGHFFCPNGRGYIRLRPIQKEMKIFDPTLLASLTTMTLSLLKPNGDLLSYTNDGNGIIKVSHDTTNNFYLMITMSHYFDKNAFFIGDYLRISNFMIFKIHESQNADLMMRLVDFMNRSQGHVITAIGEANDYGMYNSVYINSPINVNTSLGTKCVDDKVLQQLRIYNCNTTFDDNPGIMGEVINMSLQVSYSLTITTKEYEVNTELKSNVV